MDIYFVVFVDKKIYFCFHENISIVHFYSTGISRIPDFSAFLLASEVSHFRRFSTGARISGSGRTLMTGTLPGINILVLEYTCKIWV